MRAALAAAAFLVALPELLASGEVTPLAAGAEERLRAGLLAEETPSFETCRVRVVDAPGARR